MEQTARARNVNLTRGELDDLKARLAELEQENARLRRECQSDRVDLCKEFGIIRHNALVPEVRKAIQRERDKRARLTAGNCTCSRCAYARDLLGQCAGNSTAAPAPEHDPPSTLDQLRIDNARLAAERDAASNQVERLREGLGFYADWSNWERNKPKWTAENDRGQRARALLDELGKGRT